MTAIEDVLHTPELVEAILLHLPAKEVLCARNVCKYWQEVVKGSGKLSRPLWLYPSCDLLQVSKDAPDMSMLQELSVSKTYGSLWKALNDLQLHAATMKCQHRSAIANPVLARVFATPTQQNGYRLEIKASGFRLDVAEVKKKPSWLQMYVTLPPVSELEIMIKGYKCENGRYVFREKRSILVGGKDGVRIGDVVDGVMASVGKEASVVHLRIFGRCEWKQHASPEDRATSFLERWQE